jgi:hypothetical protein
VLNRSNRRSNSKATRRKEHRSIYHGGRRTAGAFMTVLVNVQIERQVETTEGASSNVGQARSRFGLCWSRRVFCFVGRERKWRRTKKWIERDALGEPEKNSSGQALIRLVRGECQQRGRLKWRTDERSREERERETIKEVFRGA